MNVLTVFIQLRHIQDIYEETRGPCGNSRIPELLKRLTTYGFDPLGKPSYGYTKHTAYDLRRTTYDLRVAGFNQDP